MLGVCGGGGGKSSSPYKGQKARIWDKREMTASTDVSPVTYLQPSTVASKVTLPAGY